VGDKTSISWDLSLWEERFGVAAEIVVNERGDWGEGDEGNEGDEGVVDEHGWKCGWKCEW